MNINMKIMIDTDIETMLALMKGLEYSITLQHEISREKREFLWKQLKGKIDRLNLGIPTSKQYYDFDDMRRSRI